MAVGDEANLRPARAMKQRHHPGGRRRLPRLPRHRLIEALPGRHDLDEQPRRARARAIRRWLWLPREARFADWDLVRRKPTRVLSAATLYPLFTGIASRREAVAAAATVRARLLAPGGLRTTTYRTGQQWDLPNGWAPLQWIAVEGLGRYGGRALARTVACRFVATVARTYRETGRMNEKYDLEQRRIGGGGEYPTQDGFGWTNGVVRALTAGGEPGSARHMSGIATQCPEKS